jgi:hypothetical protein
MRPSDYIMSRVKKSIPNTKKRPLTRNIQIMIAAVIIIIIAGLISILIVTNKPQNPLPASVVKAVPYSVYYPDTNRLPINFSLIRGSIKVLTGNIVVFSMLGPNNENIIITQQGQPASSVISRFISSTMPLHTLIGTPVGTATVGSYNFNHSLRSIVSLPVIHGPWLIITAPANINQGLLMQVVDSLRPS